MQIRQGHAYDWLGAKVISLESADGSMPVRVLVPVDIWNAYPDYADPADLAPLPMVYFHGQVPQ